MLSFFSFPSKDKPKTKKSKKGVRNYGNKRKKIFLASSKDLENCYIFSPSIGRKKNVDGKIYHVRRYFNGNRDFEISMKELATKRANKIAR